MSSPSIPTIATCITKLKSVFKESKDPQVNNQIVTVIMELELLAFMEQDTTRVPTPMLDTLQATYDASKGMSVPDALFSLSLSVGGLLLGKKMISPS